MKVDEKQCRVTYCFIAIGFFLEELQPAKHGHLGPKTPYNPQKTEKQPYFMSYNFPRKNPIAMKQYVILHYFSSTFILYFLYSHRKFSHRLGLKVTQRNLCASLVQTLWDLEIYQKVFRHYTQNYHNFSRFLYQPECVYIACSVTNGSHCMISTQNLLEKSQRFCLKTDEDCFKP